MTSVPCTPSPDTPETTRPIEADVRPLITAIHPEDEMYLFIEANWGASQDPTELYLMSGAPMLSSLESFLSELGIKLDDVGSFLEFACGYGRFTRHLVRRLDPGKVTGCDLFRGAVDFQKETFGVEGFYSELVPERLVIEHKYEVVFVASLFSHLPEAVWGNWIGKLYGALADGGVLIFSTHGESILPAECALPENGFLFHRASESRIHPVDDYGTTYVSRAFVHDAVLRETGQPVVLERVKGLFDHQDVFVVRKPSGPVRGRRPARRKQDSGGSAFRPSLRERVSPGVTEVRESAAPTAFPTQTEPSAEASAVYSVLRRYADGMAKSGEAFDPLHYLLMYPDVALSGMSPWQHYRDHGRKEGRMGAYVKPDET